MFSGARRFLNENGDPMVLGVVTAAMLIGLVALPLLGLLKGSVTSGLVGALVLEVAVSVLYVLFCANNRLYANHPSTKLAAANAETVTQVLGTDPTSAGYTFSARG